MMIWCVRDPDAVAAQICVLLAPVGETEAAREAQIVVREVLIAVIPGVAVPAAGIPEVATAMDRHGAVIADREARIAVIPVTGIHVTGIPGAATGVHVGRVAATPEGETAMDRHGAVIAVREVLIAVIHGVAIPAAGIPEAATGVHAGRVAATLEGGTAMDRHGAVIAGLEVRIAAIHVTGIHGAATGVHAVRVVATLEGATAVGRHGAVIAGQEPITETTAAPLEGIAGIGAREHPGPTTARIAQIGRLGARQVRVEAIAVEGKILQALGVVHATVDHKPRHHSACDFG